MTEAAASTEEDGMTPCQSAESFPKSHQIFYRDFSNASSVLSDLESASSTSLAALNNVDPHAERAENQTNQAEHLPSSAAEAGYATSSTGTGDETAETVQAKDVSSPLQKPVHLSTSELSTLAHQGSGGSLQSDSTAGVSVSGSAQSTLETTPEESYLVKPEPTKQIRSSAEKAVSDSAPKTDDAAESKATTLHRTKQADMSKREAEEPQKGPEEPIAEPGDKSSHTTASPETSQEDSKADDSNLAKDSGEQRLLVDDHQQEGTDAEPLSEAPNAGESSTEQNLLEAKQHQGTVRESLEEEPKAAAGIPDESGTEQTLLGDDQAHITDAQFQHSGLKRSKVEASQAGDGDSSRESTEHAVGLSADTASPKLSEGRSTSSLSPASEPFVPSAQDTGTASKEEGFSTPTRPWNVNAAAFVPSAPTSCEATPSDVSTTEAMPWPPHGQAQPGQSADSLTASPQHQSSGDQQDWSAAKYGATPAEYGAESEWQGSWANDFPCGSICTDAHGYHWIVQADGTWTLYDAWVQQNMGANAPPWQYNSNGDYEYDQELNNGDGTERGLRSRHRPEKRRNFYKDRQWNRAADAAFAEILAKQFQHSPEMIASILDLHEGSMGGILDMLGQLDAESRGQLLTDPQDAPELTEENFPSLAAGSSEDQGAQSLGASKAGFANAVRAAGSPSRDNNATPRQITSSEQTGSWDDAPVGGEQRDQAQKKVADEKYLRNDAFERAIQAAIYKEPAADSWANEGKKHSDLLIEACIAAEQVLYKHRSLTPKRRRGRLIGPLDLACLPEREAIEALESEVALHTTRRQRSPRLGADQPISILLTSPKVPPPYHPHVAHQSRNMQATASLALNASKCWVLAR